MMYKIGARVRVVDDTKCNVGYLELASVMDATSLEPILKPEMLSSRYTVIDRGLYGRTHSELGLKPNQLVYLIEEDDTLTQWIVLPEAIDKPRRARYRVRYEIPAREWSVVYDVGSEAEATQRFRQDHGPDFGILGVDVE